MDGKFYTIYEVAQLLELHHKTIRGFIADGRLKAIKAGKQWRIAREDLELFMGGEVPSRSPDDHGHITRNAMKQNLVFSTTQNTAFSATQEAMPAANESISVSTVIDIKETSKENFERISNTLLAAMNSKGEVYANATIHIKYDEETKLFKIFLWGSIDFMKEMMSIVPLLMEEKN